MAIVTYVAPFETVRGKIGGIGGGSGLVTYPIGSTNIARAFVEPANPESTSQIAIRALMTAAAQGYSALSAANAAAWVAAAVGVIRQNAAGQDYELSGANLYALINLYRTMDGQALLAAPPALTAPGAITSLTSAKTDEADLELTFAHTLDVATDFVYVRMTNELGGTARQARVNEYRSLGDSFASSIVIAGASPQEETFGLADGFDIHSTEQVGIEILPIGPTYYPGVVRRFSNVTLGAIAQ